MGDALRNILGLSVGWTKEEIELYSKITQEKLGPVYAVEGIPKNQPAERAKYWDRKLSIGDRGNEEMRLLDICEKQNKAIALAELEQIVIEKFF